MKKGMVTSKFDCRVKVDEELHKEILELRMAGNTLKDIGNTFGISGERVGQILKKKLNELKENSNEMT
jgi:DNA-directed RNA polymerase sigma subunit (sigma70/sigma32)